MIRPQRPGREPVLRLPHPVLRNASTHRRGSASVRRASGVLVSPLARSASTRTPPPARDKARAPDIVAIALCERSLVAMARREWDRAGVLAGQAGAALRQAGLEECWATSLVCAVQARAALHEGDVRAARQRLVRTQRLRSVLTYAVPHLAVQARIELARVQLALSDLAGARTPGAGSYVGFAGSCC